ncbi:MAG: hypothetical protein HRT83_06745 [Hyphomicrobiaceae bacterium]|nr:hypothetical protein [Hyphomicrobiaceae bacterium]
MWRTEELHLRSTAMAEVAMRLAEPDQTAEQSVASLGQAVRRQVSFMNDAVTRALGRAGELETLVHNEVNLLEKSYEDNERKIRNLIQDLSGERYALQSTGDGFRNTLIQFGVEVPLLVERMSQQQLELKDVIEQAETNLTQLENAVGGRTGKLQTTLLESTEKLKSVLLDYTTTLDNSIQEISSKLGLSVSQIGSQFESKIEQFEDRLGNAAHQIDGALTNRTKTIQVLLKEYASTIDTTFAERTEALDSRLVERTNLLDEAFGEKLRLFDEALGESTNALTAAVDQHAAQIDEAIVRRIDTVRTSSENISRQSIKTIEGLSDQADMLRKVSENVLDKLNSACSRFESQGNSIMRSADALKTVNYLMDQTLTDRSIEMNEILERMSQRTEELGGIFSDYSEKLEGSMSHAHEKAKSITQDLTRETEAQAQNTVNNLQRLKLEAMREADQTLGNLRHEFSAVSKEVKDCLGKLSSQFSQGSAEVRQQTAETTQELTHEQNYLKQKFDELPEVSTEKAAAMRNALQKQLRAIDQLSDLAQRTNFRSLITPANYDQSPQKAVPSQSRLASCSKDIPLTTLTNTLAREINERNQARSDSPGQSAISSNSQDDNLITNTSISNKYRNQKSILTRSDSVSSPKHSIKGNSHHINSRNSHSEKWSLTDLLSRVPEDESSSSLSKTSKQTDLADDKLDKVANDFDVNSLANALEPDMASAIWSRFKKGQRGFMVRSIYIPETRHLFDDIVYRYQSNSDFRLNVDGFVQRFERTLRQSDLSDTSGTLTMSHVMSKAGRVYLLLAHASQRLM